MANAGSSAQAGATKQYKYFAGGEWHTAENNRLFDVYQPYDRRPRGAVHLEQ